MNSLLPVLTAKGVFKRQLDGYCDAGLSMASMGTIPQSSPIPNYGLESPFGSQISISRKPIPFPDDHCERTIAKVPLPEDRWQERSRSVPIILTQPSDFQPPECYQLDSVTLERMGSRPNVKLMVCGVLCCFCPLGAFGAFYYYRANAAYDLGPYHV